MPAIKSLAIGFMAFMLAGCGQLISEKLAVSDSNRTPVCTGKKLVVLPLADYTYEDDAERAFKRNMVIMENLTARLSANGFRMPVHEDLVQYLADSGIVKTGELVETGKPGTLQNSITKDGAWSPEMRKEMARIAYSDSQQPKADNRSKGLALDQAALAKIAGNFNADLVMRGRIIQYSLDEENTWDPMKRGLLPVIFGGTNRAMFGVTNSETYDMVGSMAAGAAMGGLLGNNATVPYDATEKLNPARYNTMAWGLGGAAIGYLASQGGHANQAAVQIRLWVQDPKTAEVIWTNSVKVLVKPQTIFAETREDKLFDTAITQAISALTKDFVSKSKAIL